jgi:hypothetical protein
MNNLKNNNQSRKRNKKMMRVNNRYARKEIYFPFYRNPNIGIKNTSPQEALPKMINILEPKVQKNWSPLILETIK